MGIQIWKQPVKTLLSELIIGGHRNWDGGGRRELNYKRAPAFQEVGRKAQNRDPEISRRVCHGRGSWPTD